MTQKKNSAMEVLQHLMTGISYMVPVVAVGGILIAVSFLWGLEPTGIGATLNSLGGTVIGFMIPVFTAGVAYAIGDKPAIAPGLAIGYLSANDVGASFIGGIVGGILCGYIVVALKKVKMPNALKGIWAIIGIPLITVLVVGLLFIYVIGAPMAAIMNALTGVLENASTTSMVLLGAIMGLMTAFDMGGPCDKVAYGFSTALLAEGVTMPMAANMAAGMTAPIGLALATILFKNLFTDSEKEAGKVAWALGASFITEGAIPFAAGDPLHVLPATMIGSAVTGALSMLFGCTLNAPHGGIFAIIIPGVVNSPLLYILAIVIGAVVTALLVGVLKRLKKN